MQSAMAEKDKEIRELEERTTALVDAERARNEASTRAIYQLFVSGSTTKMIDIPNGRLVLSLEKLEKL
ncbi:hypothetical protein ZWY2020_037909 [Hordeum vulgare]|nr:hypothetical protein ZWY2020_037909 [Hordeum vulgare]